MNKKNTIIFFMGLIWYVIIRFLKDYFLGLLYLMISGFNESGIEIFGLFAQSVILILSPIFFAKVINIKSISHEMGERKSARDILGIKNIGKMNGLKSVFIGVICFFTFNLIKNCIVLVVASFGKNVTVRYVDTPQDTVGFLFVMLMFCLWMPLGEELLYRGMLFHMVVERKNVVILMITNQLVFAGAHEYGEQAIQAFFLGLLLCMFTYKTKSISAGIIIHIVFNLIGMVISYYFPLSLFTIFGINENCTPNEMRLGASYMLFVAIALLIMLIVLISTMQFSSINSNEVEEQDRKSEKMSAFVIAAWIIIILISFGRLVYVLKNTGLLND